MKPLLLAVALLCWAEPAQGAPLTCGPRAEIVAALSGAKWREVPIASAISTAGELVETWASAGGETWSLVVSAPGGLTCVWAVGLDLQVKSLPADGPPT